MWFRKRPIIVRAIQFDGTPRGAVWLFEQLDIPGAKFVPDNDLRTGVITIETLEGVMEAGHGDWIIEGVNGEFYPCKPDIFEQTYEPVFKSDTDRQG